MLTGVGGAGHEVVGRGEELFICSCRCNRVIVVATAAVTLGVGMTKDAS